MKGFFKFTHWMTLFRYRMSNKMKDSQCFALFSEDFNFRF